MLIVLFSVDRLLKLKVCLMLKGGKGGVERESEENECGALQDFITKGLTARLRGRGAEQFCLVTGGLADWTGGLERTGRRDWTGGLEWTGLADWT